MNPLEIIGTGAIAFAISIGLLNFFGFLTISVTFTKGGK
jgi:hypothetical protein